MKQALLGFLKLACYLLGLVQIYLLIERKLGWKRSVVSLCYHSIPAEAPTDAISMLEGGTCRTSLDAQIKILSKWLQPIDDSTLLGWLNRKVTLEPRRITDHFRRRLQEQPNCGWPHIEELRGSRFDLYSNRLNNFTQLVLVDTCVKCHAAY